MGVIDQCFEEFCHQRFPVPNLRPFQAVDTSPLHLIYNDFNGGYFWGSALLIRPYWPVEFAPLSVAEWNHEALWKGRYGEICRDIIFFAEDVFGCPFGLSMDGVVHFDPETAVVKIVAGTFDGWCREICSNTQFYTGYPVLAGWESKHGKLLNGKRLIPRQLFMLGGEYHSDNMTCMTDLHGMLVRAELWHAIKDLPDGTSIVLEETD